MSQCAKKKQPEDRTEQATQHYSDDDADAPATPFFFNLSTKAFASPPQPFNSSLSITTSILPSPSPFKTIGYFNPSFSTNPLT